QKDSFNRGSYDQPFGPPPSVTYPIQVIAGLNAALRERQQLPGYSRDQHAAAAAAIRRGALSAGLIPYEGSWPLSNAVVRIDIPPPLKEVEIRARLLEAGIFVIGNIGRSAGGSIRIG